MYKNNLFFTEVKLLVPIGAALQNLLKLLERIIEDAALSVPILPKPHVNDEVIIY